MTLFPQVVARFKAYIITPEFLLIAAFGAISFVLFVMLFYAKRVVHRRLEAHVLAHKLSMAEFLDRTSIFFLLFFSLQCITWFMELEPAFEKFIDQCFMVVFFVQIAVWGEYALTDLALNQFQKHKKAKDLQAAGAFSLIRLGIRVSVWAIIGMIILRNFGFDVTALITGFGIGGIAIGLASQKILADLFASLSIILDKPFSQGDFIVFDGYEGFVEEIGLKSTHIRSITGEQIVCSNAYLLDTRIKNYQRMKERRNTVYYHLSTENKPEILEKMVDEIKTIFKTNKKVRLDRVGVSKIFRDVVYYEVVFWVDSPLYSVSADIIYGLNIDVMQKAKSLKVLFPKDYGAGE